MTNTELCKQNRSVWQVQLSKYEEARVSKTQKSVDEIHETITGIVSGRSWFWNGSVGTFAALELRMMCTCEDQEKRFTEEYLCKIVTSASL